jgi:hypothetical protein
MGELQELLAETLGRLTDLAHLARPWGLPALPIAALLLVIGRRYRFISVPGVIMLLVLALYALTIRAIRLGTF